MARPSRNGVAERGIQTPRDAKIVQANRAPIGRAPQDFTPDERDMWNAIVRECPWVDRSHRRWLRVLALSAARVDRITKYFRRRQKEFAAEGEEVALAYLDDDGKRHPLMTDLLAAEEGLRKGLTALGASPASQVRMMSEVGTARQSAQVAESRQRYFQ